MDSLTIGQLARAAGVHVETVRYYQRRALLATPARPAGGIRRYPQAEVARLLFIKRAQEIGFSLDEVRQLLRLERTPGCRDARALAASKLGKVESRIAGLQRVRDALRRLVAQCDASAERDCPIIRTLARSTGP